MLRTNFEHIAELAFQDAVELKKKDASYGSSWAKRGGVGAFMMLARKWDRIETQATAKSYDIFTACGTAFGDGDSVLDDLRDLRRYLLLVEERVLALRKEAAEAVNGREKQEYTLRETVKYPQSGIPMGTGLEHQHAYENQIAQRQTAQGQTVQFAQSTGYTEEGYKGSSILYKCKTCRMEAWHPTAELFIMDHAERTGYMPSMGCSRPGALGQVNKAAQGS